ncbi:MAG: cytochrome c3 family protein [Planctomycetota bacterium]|jgi:predicted CXXCH cytochrome family protein
MVNRNALNVVLTAGLGVAFFASCTLFEGLRSGKKKPAGPVVFTHQLHTDPDGEDMACDECHAGGEKAPEAGMPALEVCTDCHEEPEQASERERDAFRELNARVAAKKPLWGKPEELSDLKFDHGLHAGITYLLPSGQKKPLECDDCHEDAGSSEITPLETTPPMELCTDCHALGKTAVKAGDKPIPGVILNDCSVCHETYRRDVEPEDHRGLWRVTHGEEIAFGFEAEEAKRCAYCHEETYCVRCHQEEKPRNHNNLFRLYTHGIDATLNRERCSTCHREDFCIRCHRDTRPLTHSTATWAMGTYRHCTECHYPIEMNRCYVCHKTTRHAFAPLYPRDSSHTGSCLMSCHSRQHPDPGEACTLCHK